MTLKNKLATEYRPGLLGTGPQTIGGSKTFTDPAVFSVNSSTDALKITQAGTGNALLVEDQASDTTPFVVKADGNVGVGTTSPLEALHVTSNARVDGILKLGADARIIRGTDDPTSVAKDAESGSLYLRQSVNTVFPDAYSALGSGFAAEMWAFAVYNNELYVGGSLGTFAKWNGTSWITIAFPKTGPGTIFALEVYNGYLYLGGYFIDGGGITGANHIVRYDGSTYSAVGTSIATSSVNALKTYQGNLYLSSVSNFSGLGSQIARWNGSAYSAVGAGITGGIKAFAIYNDDLYIGGEFTNGGGISGANNLIRFNGSTYSIVGTNNAIATSAVYALAVYNNELYIAGSFTNAVNNAFLKWTGTSFAVPGSSSGTFFTAFHYPQALAVSGSYLYIAGGTPASTGITRFDGSVYTGIGFGTGANSLFSYNNELLIAGGFTDFGGIAAADGVVKLTPSYTISTPSGVYAKNDNGTTTNWKELGSGSTDKVTQASHGFAVGDVLYLNGSTYAKASASSAATSEVVGVVSRISDSNNFEILLNGELSGLVASSYTENALPATGEAVFLSTTAGKLTITEPSVVGQVSLPVGVASGSGTLYVLPKRGAVVGGANARTLVGLTNNTSTSIQLVTAYDAGELTGWVNLPNSTPANSKKFYVQVQFAKNGPGTDYNVAFQTTGDTPPAGFNIDYSGGYVRVTLPNVSGLTNASINFALNAPAVGATLPLAIDSENVMFGTVKPKDANGINVRNFANTATNLSIADTGVVSFFNAINFDYTAVTSATTLNTTHYYVSASGSTTYAITLPTAVGVQGRVYIVKSNMNAGVLLTVNTTSSQTIDGATSRSLARFESLQVISNGSNWEVF